MHYKYQANELLPRSQILAGRLCDSSLMYLHYWAYIFRRESRFTFSSWHRLGTAVVLGLVDLVAKFLDEGDASDELVPGYYQSRRNFTSLLVASICGNMGVVRALLRAGADLRWQNSFRESLLTSAASNGHSDVLQLLFNYGVDVNWQSKRARSASPAASEWGHAGTVAFLVQKGADLGVRDLDSNEDALALACCYGCKEIVECLIDNGVDLHVATTRRGPTIYAACRTANQETVELLMSKGADLYGQVDLIYKTTLQAACTGGSSAALVRYLIENGVDVNAPSGLERTALQATCKHSYRDTNAQGTIKLLIEKKAQANVSDSRNGTPLQLACNNYSLSIEIVKILIEHGADVNARGGSEGSPLSCSLRNHHQDIAELLGKNAATLAKGEEENLACFR